jgi:hypothetical protein
VQNAKRAIGARGKQVDRDRTPADRAMLNNELDFLGQLESAAKTDSRLRALEEANGGPDLELSVVICLKLEDGNLIDLARFGDFDSPQP